MAMPPDPIDPAVLALQTRALQAMSPARKLELAGELRTLAWQLTALGLRVRHPDLAEPEIERLTREAFGRVAR